MLVKFSSAWFWYHSLSKYVFLLCTFKYHQISTWWNVYSDVLDLSQQNWMARHQWLLLRFPRLTPPINNQHALDLGKESVRQINQIMFKASPLSSETQFWEEAAVVAPPLRYLSRSPGSMGFWKKRAWLSSTAFWNCYYTPQQLVPHNQEQSLPGQAASLPKKHKVGHMRSSISRTTKIQNYHHSSASYKSRLSLF